MRYSLQIFGVVLLVFGLAFWGRWHMRRDVSRGPNVGGDCRRIVSLAPSITETLYELGLGERVVAVTDYCKFPSEARAKSKVGGYLDCNSERIAMLKPDLVVALEEHEDSLTQLDELNIGVLTVTHLCVDDVPDSIIKIGSHCGVEERAKSLVAEIKRRLDKVAEKTAGLRRPSVLVVVDRSREADRLRDVYIAGNEGHLGRIVELAGGRNAYEGSVRFPVVSVEGIAQMNPDVIFDCVPEELATVDRKQRLLEHWSGLDCVSAVHNDRVHIIADDHATIPGPNFADTVEDFLKLIHPEID